MGQLAAAQFGRVARRQLLGLGIARQTVDSWVEQAYLYRVHPGVYAVGHRPRSVEADLAAAILYAGPGAMLSHGTAAWWHGLLPNRPSRIDVSTPRWPGKRPRIRLHPKRELDRVWREGLPVTTVAQTLLDFAAVASRRRLRFVLANADYAGKLDVAAIEALLGRAVAAAAPCGGPSSATSPAWPRRGVSRSASSWSSASDTASRCQTSTHTSPAGSSMRYGERGILWSSSTGFETTAPGLSWSMIMPSSWQCAQPASRSGDMARTSLRTMPPPSRPTCSAR